MENQSPAHRLKTEFDNCILLLTDPDAAQAHLNRLSYQYKKDIESSSYNRSLFLDIARIVALARNELNTALQYSEELLKLAAEPEVSKYSVCVAAIDYVKVSRILERSPSEVMDSFRKQQVFNIFANCKWGASVLEELLIWQNALEQDLDIINTAKQLFKIAGIPYEGSSRTAVQSLKSKLEKY